MTLTDLIKKFFESLKPKSSTSSSSKEDYYNNKYPKQDILYKGRVVPGTSDNVEIDIRDFFTPFDSEVKKVVVSIVGGGADDDKALKCLLWVIDNVKYVGDKTRGHREFWQFGFETLHYKTGDCEDGAILLANMLLVAGIPYWKIRLSMGLTKNGVHVYLTYYCESSDKWIVLDWCYLVNKKKVKERKDYKDEGNYLKVGFSWNLKYSFAKGLNVDAKHLLSGK